MKVIRSCATILAICIGVNAQAQSTIFSSPGTYSYTVPVGTTCISVDMAGAQGGNGFGSGAGGKGGRLQCILAVTPGEVLSIYVGGPGGSSFGSLVAGGVNGASGGAGGGSGGGPDGGGGGGSTDIRVGGTVLANRVLIAAGGGGGSSGLSGDAGGAGGGATGGNGTGAGVYSSFYAGSGGTATSGGAGASGGGATGSLGAGGNGGVSGGGGGGGYFGGGGGWYGSGGGGSSYPTSSTAYCASVTTTSGYQTGNGYVSLTTGTCATATISGGTTPICVGATTTLTATPAGGTWSSGTPSVATVGSSGVVLGASAGTSVITYTPASGFPATVTVTVISAPSAGTITGSASAICVTHTLALTDVTPGGVWSSASGSIASVGTGGIVTGVTAGTTTISYTVSNSCGSNSATYPVTVEATPSAGTVTGPSATVCVGHTLALSDAAPGGVWSVVPTTIATIGSGSGIVTGVANGTAVVSYTVTNSCGAVSATYPITVNPLPSAGTITGSSSTVCISGTLTLTDASTGGVWTIAPSTVATIGSGTGIVSGVSAGVATVTYTVTSGCGTATATYAVTVDAMPSAGTITDTSTTVCTAGTMAVSDGVTGGAWTTALGNATISPAGIVTGVTAGIDTVVYTVTNVCGSAHASLPITVVNCTSGISRLQADGNVNLYPNPVSELLVIRNDARQCCSFSITNAMGVVLLQGNLNSGETKLNVNNLPAGVYYVTVKGTDLHIIRRFVKM